MIHSNAHSHSTYCDGKNSLEEMIQAAIQKGFHTIGFSGHSPLDFEHNYPMEESDVSKYLDELHVLKEKYKGQIDVVIGIEWDYFSKDMHKELFEYAIGSVHHIYSEVTGKYYAYDNTVEEFDELLNVAYQGDEKKLIADYYDNIIKMINELPVEVIGHIDLIRKMNEDNRFFDENSDFYYSYAKKAIDAGIQKNLIFEINTGGIYRGYRKEPYPSRELLKYIVSQHGKLMINSDSHNCDSLDFYFDEALSYAASCGVKELYVLTKDGFLKEAI